MLKCQDKYITREFHSKIKLLFYISLLYEQLKFIHEKVLLTHELISSNQALRL